MGTLTRTQGGIVVRLDLYRAGDAVRVEGLVLPPDGVIRPVHSVEVRHGTTCVAGGPLDEQGGFTLLDVPVGLCRLTLVGHRLRLYLDVDLDPGAWPASHSPAGGAPGDIGTGP